jgi:hypothetical protein
MGAHIERNQSDATRQAETVPRRPELHSDEPTLGTEICHRCPYGSGKSEALNRL